MSKYFSEEETIKQYFYQHIVNLQNETSFNSHKLKQIIENLRNLVRKHFSLDEYIVVFLPNMNVVHDLLKAYLKSSNLHTSIRYQDGINSDFDFFTKKSSDLNHTQAKTSSDVCDQNLKNVCELICVNLDKLIYEFCYSGINNIDFLTFDPSHSFNVYGVVVFMFKKTHKIKPIYFGSSHNKELPHSLECGTQNYPNLLLLERYFFFLLQNKKNISEDLTKQILLEKKFQLQTHLINFNKIAI